MRDRTPPPRKPDGWDALLWAMVLYLLLFIFFVYKVKAAL